MNIAYELLGGLQWGNWVNNVGVAECVFAIIVMVFIKQAEPIVRKIFGFDNAGSLGSAIASGALLMSSMKTASNAIGKAKDAKGNGGKNTKNNNSKPQPSSNANRNTTNINNTTNANSGTTTPNPNQSNPNSGANTQNGQGATNGTGGGTSANNTSAGGTPQGSGQSSTTQNNQQGNRNLNTSRTGESEEEKKQRRNDRIKKVIGTGVSVGFRATGAAIGAFASDDAITGGITGFGYGTAFGEGAKALGGKAAEKGKKIANTVTRRKNLNKSTNELIDEYNKLKSKTGWNDDLMYRNSENLLNISDLSKVSNPNLRSYGETLHKYRKAFEDKYQAPDDMVLDAIDKIQTGELEKTDESVKRYTRKK